MTTDPTTAPPKASLPAAGSAAPPPGKPATLDKLMSRLVWGAVLGVLVFAGFSLYADVGLLWSNLQRYQWLYLPPAVALVCLNYGIRFLRWHYYLKLCGLELAVGPSASVFFSGFVMSVTPGKFGEVLKSLLLRESIGVPIARTAPIVIAERLTDFISLVLLSSVGILTFQYGRILIAVSAVLSLVAVVLISSRPLALTCISLTRKVPGVRKLSDKFLEMYESMADLVRPGPLVWATLLGLCAWLVECVGVWLLMLGLGADADSVTLPMAIFIHAFATIFGALTMLPGGLGVTEGSMTGLLVLLGKMTQAPAVAATLLVRLCTLWFGVVVGLLALMRWRKAHATSPPGPLSQKGEGEPERPR